LVLTKRIAASGDENDVNLGSTGWDAYASSSGRGLAPLVEWSMVYSGNRICFISFPYAEKQSPTNGCDSGLTGRSVFSSIHYNTTIDMLGSLKFKVDRKTLKEAEVKYLYDR